MKEILLVNWLSVVIVLLFLLILIALWQRGKKDQVKLVIFWLVAEAEKKLGDKAGVYKYGHVIDKFYNRLPIIITLFFTKKEINDWIELAVQELKKYLESGKTLEGDFFMIEEI